MTCEAPYSALGQGRATEGEPAPALRYLWDGFSSSSHHESVGQPEEKPVEEGCEQVWGDGEVSGHGRIRAVGGCIWHTGGDGMCSYWFPLLGRSGRELLSLGPGSKF